MVAAEGGRAISVSLSRSAMSDAAKMYKKRVIVESSSDGEGAAPVQPVSPGSLRVPIISSRPAAPGSPDRSGRAVWWSTARPPLMA